MPDQSLRNKEHINLYEEFNSVISKLSEEDSNAIYAMIGLLFESDDFLGILEKIPKGSVLSELDFKQQKAVVNAKYAQDRFYETFNGLSEDDQTIITAMIGYLETVRITEEFAKTLEGGKEE